MKGPLKIEGLFVEVKYGNFEKALRTFNKKVQDSGKLRELRDREGYEKPSIKRTRAKQLAVKREQRRVSESRLTKDAYTESREV